MEDKKINKILEQQETIKGLQNNQESLIKIMKDYEQLIKKYDLMKTNANQLAKRIDKALELIYKNAYSEDRKELVDELWYEIPELVAILKGESNE